MRRSSNTGCLTQLIVGFLFWPFILAFIVIILGAIFALPFMFLVWPITLFPNLPVVFKVITLLTWIAFLVSTGVILYDKYKDRKRDVKR